MTERLQRLGHRVYAPTLTGLGERSHLLAPSINLSTHIADVAGEMVWKDLTEVVLVGHSYGGMVISGAAQKVSSRIRSIVYLDAFLPQDGQSLRDITGTKAPATDGPLPPFPATEFVGPENAEWVGRRLAPQAGCHVL